MFRSKEDALSFLLTLFVGNGSRWKMASLSTIFTVKITTQYASIAQLVRATAS